MAVPVVLSDLFSPSCRFVSALLEKPEVEVTGASQGPTGSIIHSLFVSAQRVRGHSVCVSSLHLQSLPVLHRN